MLEEAVLTAGDLMTRDVAVVRPDASLLVTPIEVPAVVVVAKSRSRRPLT